jgi:hypothetical protein
MNSVATGVSTGPLYDISFDGALLSRGFWLYVCEIMIPDGRTIHYVGKTGDKASRVCQSPFNRLTNHLGGNKNSNALKRHLSHIHIDPQSCEFRFLAYGPLFGDGSQRTHGELCDVTSGLEKALANAMTEAGYAVINKVQCRTPLDLEAFAAVRTAFAARFSQLSSGNPTATMREFATSTKKHGGHR